MRDRYLLVAAIGLILYFLPFVISGKKSNILIHDNLDSIFANYVVLAREGKVFSLPNTIVESPMSGLPRMYFPTGMSVLAVLCMVAQPITAYLLNFILVHLIAFVGMYMLLKQHFLKETEFSAIAVFSAFCFSIVPFYTVYGISAAGVPLLSYAFLNLRMSKAHRIEFLIIGLFPFYSSLFLVGIFALLILSVVVLVDYMNNKLVIRDFILGIGLLTCSYVLVEHQLFYQFFFNAGELSHRSEMVLEQFEFTTVIERAEFLFYNSQYHASSPPGFVFTILALAVILGISLKHKDTSILIFLFLCNVSFAFIYGLYNWEMMDAVWRSFPLTGQIQWNRFYFLSPAIWFLQLALAIRIIKESTNYSRASTAFVFFLCMYQLYFVWKSNVEYRETSYNLFSKQPIGWSFDSFFDEQLFGSIKAAISRPLNSYRVGSIGMHPSVAQYNGFQTIDGYMASYPLTYKGEFRKILGPEINRNETLRKYFDEWGSRCYLFSSELVFNLAVEKNTVSTLNDLRLDFENGPVVDFILSAVEIKDPERLHLKQQGVFERSNSRWRIFLYETQPRN